MAAVRCPRVPPVGRLTEGKPVPNTEMWTSPGVDLPPLRKEAPHLPIASWGRTTPAVRGWGGPYPKPTQVGGQSMLRPRENHPEGTRQDSPVTSGEGVSNPSHHGGAYRPPVTGYGTPRGRACRYVHVQGWVGRHSSGDRDCLPKTQGSANTPPVGCIGPDACPVPVGEGGRTPPP